MTTKVKDLAHLRELIGKGVNRYFIVLRFGLKSSKWIEMDGDNFCVFNEIDGSDDIFTAEEIMNDRYTNIGRAMTCGALICES